MILSKRSIFALFFALTTLEYVLVYTSFGDLPTPFWWGFNTIFLLFAILLIPSHYNKHQDSDALIFVKLFLIWNMISVFRGMFIADNYWEWKNLINVGLMFLIPLVAYLFTNKDLLQKVLSFWFKYMIYPIIFFIPFVHFSDFFGRYFSPFLLLLLLFPLLPYRWKLATLLITFLIIITGLDSRSHVIRFGIAFGLGSLYYFRALLIEQFFKSLHAILITLPIILLLLGLSGVFNVYQMDKYISGNYTVQTNESGQSSESLTADTRTFLYVEVISSAIKHNYVLWGRTPARGYDSLWFGAHTKYELQTGKMERFASEVGILNVFTWTGLVGVVLYFLIFFQASFLAIYRSNNYFIKLIGLFVAFRWAYAFVEEYSNFNIQYIFLWVLIAMCFSTSFRAMSDDEFKTWIRDLLRNARLIKLRK